MKKFTRRAFVVAMAALLPFASTSSFAQGADIKERALKFTTQNPKGHPLVIGMEKFAEVVAAKSGGKIKVNLFPGGVLGGDVQIISSMQGGSIEMASMNSGILANQIKDFEVFDFPFMFANGKEADAVVDGPFGKKLHARLADKGLVGLTYWELGFRNVTNSKRQIKKVEDFAGLKLRVIPSKINVDWVSALSANPTPLAFPEVYAALEQKAIDGQENPLTVINANKFFEVQKYLTITNHQYNPQSVLVSKKFWDTLSETEKKIFNEAAAESTITQRKAAREQAVSVLDALKKAGMDVNELAPAEVAKLREVLKPVIEKHGAPIAETVKELQAELAKARK